jgi:hypothetical protein
MDGPYCRFECPIHDRGNAHTFSVVANLAPKRIGLLGFENVTASHLTGAADAFAAAALDDGYGNRIPLYEVCTIGLTAAPFQSESGSIFKPQKTLRTAPELDSLLRACKRC